MFVERLFGYMPTPREKHKQKQISKVIFEEAIIEGDYRSLVQNRVAIDRFTGGAFESALFAEQPVFGGRATIQFAVKEADEAEIGLLLLVLKDLWTGYLPVGGEASVGRGRLQGQTAVIDDTVTGKAWRLNAGADTLVVEGNAATLEAYVTRFVQAMEGER